MKNLLLLSMILSSVVASAATISNRAGTDLVVSSCADQDEETGYCDSIILTRVNVDEKGLVTKTQLTSSKGLRSAPGSIAKSFRKIVRAEYDIDQNPFVTQQDVLDLSKDALAQFKEDMNNVEANTAIDAGTPAVAAIPLEVINSSLAIGAYALDGTVQLIGDVGGSIAGEIGAAAGETVVGAKELSTWVASQKIRVAFHKMYKNKGDVVTLSDKNYAAFLEAIE